MVTGSCFCGKLRIEFTGDPKTVAVCHCSNCRHYTGGLSSYNLVVPSSHFIVHGNPQSCTVIADSKNAITNCFCGDCGTTMYRYGDAFGGIDGDRVVQGGVIEDLEYINKHQPSLEMFTEARVSWIHAMDDQGVAQFEGMPKA